jgi:hypothetical protein
MSTGRRLNKLSGVVLLSAAVLCVGGVAESHGDSVQTQTHHKTKAKKPQLPPLPSGPTGRPVQQIPLDSIAAVPPQVSYQDKQLTIVAPNSTLADILRAVRKQTGADIEIPAAPERVVTHLGPGPARDVLSDLLNGSRFNYVLLGSPGNDAILTRVVLVPKAGQDAGAPPVPTPDGQPAAQAANTPPPDQDPLADANDADSNDDNAAEDNGDQAAEAEQPPAANPDQPAVKTPQQMLQEMQQRQLMIQQGQQQQQPGQPPVPGTVPHPPQEQ